MQILQCIRIIRNKCSECLAMIQFLTVTACCYSFFYSALTNTAELLTIYGFHPFDTTPLAIDMFGQNRRLI